MLQRRFCGAICVSSFYRPPDFGVLSSPFVNEVTIRPRPLSSCTKDWRTSKVEKPESTFDHEVIRAYLRYGSMNPDLGERCKAWFVYRQGHSMDQSFRGIESA